MRANFFCNTVYITNSDIQFRVYEFVKLLNSIIGKNDVFGRLNLKDIKDRQKEKKKKLEDNEKSK
jgi:hypothetical protein